jgi:WXG100 family type VII secretion target
MPSRARSLGVSAPPVSASLTTIRSALEAMERELALLDRRVEELEAGWSGEARDAFVIAMRECRATLADLHHIADGAARVAQESVVRFDDFDRRRSSAWTR